MISLILRGGTLIALAKAFCESPRGFKKSSKMISPGDVLCLAGGLSMVVDDLDVMRVSLDPGKAQPPLIVHSNRVLTIAISAEHLQTVSRRISQILDIDRNMDQGKLAQRSLHDFRSESTTAAVVP
jgi:hypothetical protein